MKDLCSSKTIFVLTCCLVVTLLFSLTSFQVRSITTFKESTQVFRKYPYLGAGTNDTQSATNKEETLTFSSEKQTKADPSSEVLFTLKSTRSLLSTRVTILAKTWFTKAENIQVITDKIDPGFAKHKDFELVPTKCGRSHSMEDLCCKTGSAYNQFVNHKDLDKFNWWCHMDDDNYVIVPNLLKHLSQFDPKTLVYIGRKSIPFGVAGLKDQPKERYHFGTGGAGVCFSKALAVQMKPRAGGDNFVKTCVEVHGADDCILGFIANKLLNVPLSESFLFHSHIENLRLLHPENLTQQIFLSYQGQNTLIIPNARFTVDEDPSQLYSLHCKIYPDDDICLS